MASRTWSRTATAFWTEPVQGFEPEVQRRVDGWETGPRMADMAEMADFQAIFSGFRGVKFQPLENGADKNLTYNWCLSPKIIGQSQVTSW